MKSKLFYIISLIPFVAAAQSGSFTIKGKIDATGDVNPMVYLTYSLNGKLVNDSALVQKGTFQFKGNIPAPLRASILLDKAPGVKTKSLVKDFKIFYIEPGLIQLEAEKNIKDAIVKAGAVNVAYLSYLSEISQAQKNAQQASLDYRKLVAASPNEKELIRDAKGKQDIATKALADANKNYAIKNTESYISILAIKGAVSGRARDLPSMEYLYKGLSSKIQNSPEGKELLTSINTTKSIAIGSIAPYFAQNDVNDKPVKLSDFKGKYVLLDFWASWCGPCRAENPNLVKAFHQFKDKNFTVLGVSLDQPGKKQAWLDAIKKDGLEWTHVSDLKYWDNDVAKLYGVRAVPQNFLIDPSGKIIAYNLRGTELVTALARYIK